MDRQRIIILFAAALLSAMLLAGFVYKTAITPKQEPRTPVFALTHDIAIGQAVHKSDLKKVQVLARDIPSGAVLADKDAVDHVALFPLAANTPLVKNALAAQSGPEGLPSTIAPGYRAVAVTITDVSGVAGLIQPGGHVDVLFTRPGSMAEAITSTILQNVKVLAIGHNVVPGAPVDPKAQKIPVATLLVTPSDAQKLELAKNQGRISLSLRNPLDSGTDLDGKPIATDTLDPAMRAKLAVTEKLRSSPNLTDPKAWDALAGVKPKDPPVPPVPVVKEKPAPPPPPRAVVDVFRGDKHVQEVFHD